LIKVAKLTKTNQYDYVFKNGKRFVSPYLLLVSAKSKHEDQTRFGIIASKKVGKAVSRNRAKRRIREVIRKFEKNINPGFDNVIIAFDKIKEAEIHEISASFEKLLKSSGQLT